MKTAEGDVQSRLLELVEAFPGLHLREVARQLGISESLAGYHVDRLVEQRLIRSETTGGFRRFFGGDAPRPGSTDERRLLALLRQRVPLRIVLILLERGTTMHAELTRDLCLSKATVSYQLAKLAAARVIRHVEAGGYCLVDRASIKRVLTRWKPTPDVAERFAELWESLYSRRHPNE